VIAKCRIVQNVQMFMMQAVREGSKCQPMIMFNEWIRRIKEIGNKGKM
jgi:hypothetical protein